MDKTELYWKIVYEANRLALANRHEKRYILVTGRENIARARALGLKEKAP